MLVYWAWKRGCEILGGGKFTWRDSCAAGLQGRGIFGRGILRRGIFFGWFLVGGIFSRVKISYSPRNITFFSTGTWNTTRNFSFVWPKPGTLLFPGRNPEHNPELNFFLAKTRNISRNIQISELKPLTKPNTFGSEVWKWMFLPVLASDDMYPEP